ncbi:MAG: hypothetical protein WC639_05315 [Patescibacteria group bacterium]|jgi:hypothetical protein
MKQFFSLISLVALVGMAVAGLASAATDTVTATVTVAYASVTLDQASFAYGSVAVNTASSTVNLWGGVGITGHNGGAESSFELSSSDSTGWTLSNANNTGNNYMHKFCNETAGGCTVPADQANYDANPMSTGYLTLDSSVAYDEDVAFQLQVLTPATPTSFVEQSITVTLQASAN